MTKSEWEALTEGWGGKAADGEVAGLLQALLAGQQTQSSASELRRIVVQPGVESLVSYPAPVASTPTVSSTSSSSSESKDEGSVASTVMKTIALATGVGPVVTGLLKLFGGGGDDPKESLYTPIPYSLPEQISVEAGLHSDRSFTTAGYAANGISRSLNPDRSTPVEQTAPQIQINVQAMDSRSFTDHSDEIARAVREALLRSHSLNDVIAEM